MIADSLPIAIGGYGTGVMAAGGVFYFLWRHFVRAIREEIAPVRSQVSRNGGDSMRDAVDRTERAVQKLQLSLTRHLEWHIENQPSEK